MKNLTKKRQVVQNIVYGYENSSPSRVDYNSCHDLGGIYDCEDHLKKWCDLKDSAYSCEEGYM